MKDLKNNISVHYDFPDHILNFTHTLCHIPYLLDQTILFQTSHDGGDSTSITSGVENEVKKSAMKPKKSSLKRKAPNFSQESDDTVIEPLLQREKEKSEPQSAKYFGKGKTDSLQNKESDNKAKTTTTTGFCGTTESLLSFKDSESTKTTAGVTAPLHNYMNTNVFNTHDNAKANVTTKSQILVEINSSKQSSYTPSPLIFTTAKIHTDSKTKQMEPVLVTPVPILSTIEVNVSKGGSIISNERKISNGSSVINPVYTPMPLSKGKEEKITLSSFSTVISPTTNKDAFSKTITVTSAPKLANITTAQNSSMKITLPSTTSISLLMKSSPKEKQGDIKDDTKEQTWPQTVQLPSKSFNLDKTKNNVTAKTIMTTTGKGIDISTTSAKSSQGDNSVIQKVDAGDNLPVNISSYNSQHFTSNNKTQASRDPVAISNPAKTTSSSVGNKQLHRQKTTTEETSDMKSKVDTNIEHAENSSAKKLSSSEPKIIDSISIKDGKVPNVSANNTQSIHSKSSLNDTANLISKTTSISTTTKPTATSVASSNNVMPSIDVSSKPATTNTISKAEKTVPPTTTTTNTLSNVNKINTASIVSSIGLTKSSPKDVAKTSIPTSIVTSTSKTLPEKMPVVTSTAKTVSASSDKNKTASVTTVKPSTEVAKTTATTLTQPTITTSKTTATKTPSVTSVKATLASATTSTGTKPSSSTPQVSSITSPLTSGSITVSKAPAVTTSIPKTLSGTASPKSTTPQNITSPQGSGNKQASTAVGINVASKIPSAVSSEKSSAVNSSAPVSAGIKSPNNNSSQIFGTPKPSTTSIPKTESVTTLSKTSAASSSVISSAAKSPKDTSAPTTNKKDSAVSVKKPAATKTSVATKSPSVSSANKSIVGTTTKISSSADSSVPTSAAKKTGAPVTAKTGSTTTSTKIPTTSTLKKVPDVTSSSSATTSVAAIKPTTTSATQVSANKLVGSAGSSVPSFTPPLRPSELDKKGGSKSSENNKDGKDSKA